MLKGFAVLTLCFLVDSSGFSQEAKAPATTERLNLSLAQSEELFVKNNLTLLAARFEVSSNKALALQARLWANPSIQVEQNTYNPLTDKWFDTSDQGNTELQVSQLIYIAGKYSQRVKVADWTTKISEYQFEDLLRTLKFQLRAKFYLLGMRREQLQFVEESLTSLEKTILSAEKAFEKRSILLTELLRLKSLRTTLNGNKLDLIEEIEGTQRDLKNLLFAQPKPNTELFPIVRTQVFDQQNLSQTLPQLRKEFDPKQRVDIKVLGAQVSQEEENLQLQKLTPIPDLTLGYRYSRAGSYIREYSAVTVGLELPLFDFNRGNIEASRADLAGKKANLDLSHASAINDFSALLSRLDGIDGIWRGTDKKMTQDYSKLLTMMIHNYEKRNMTILAFADFVDSYRTGLQDYQNLRLRRLQTAEEVNMSLGKDFFRPEGDK